MILVLGATGYLGSLLHSSSFKDQIVNPKSPHLSRLLHDIPQTKLNEIGFQPEKITDVIIVASKPKLEKWTLSDFHSNVKIVEGVVNNFRHSRVVFFSSADVYGNSPNLPITESGDLSGNTLYAKSKILSEKILQDNFALDKLVIFRLPGVYGGSPRAHGLMDLFVRNTRNNQPIILDSEDVLDVKRDWVYGPDIIQIISQLILKNETHGGVFNLVTGVSLPISQWIAYAEKIANSQSRISIRNPMVHHEIFDIVFDNNRLTHFFPELIFTPVEQVQIL